VFALLVFIYGVDLFSLPRLRAADLLFVGESPSQHIVIAAIDDASLSAFGRTPTEWPRAVYAQAVRRLADAGARVIAFDLLLPESALGDRAVGQALADVRAGESRTRVVLAVAGLAPARATQTEAGLRTIKFASGLLPVPVIAASADYLGMANAQVDPDGLLRQQFSFGIINDTLYPSFSLAAYLAYLRVPAEAFTEVIRADGDALHVTDARRLWVGADGRWRQDFISPVGEGVPVVSFRDVVDDAHDLTSLNDKIVLIGLYRAAGAVDTYAVPANTTGVEMPGVEIQANAIETLIRNTALQTQPIPALMALLFALSLSSALLYEQMRWGYKLLLMVVLLIGLIVAASYLFSTQRYVIGLFDAALALVLPALVSIGLEITRESRARQRAEMQAAALGREQRLLGEIVNGLPVATVVLDREARVERVNELFKRSFPNDGWALLVERLAASGLPEQHVGRLRDSFAARADFSSEIQVIEKTYTLAANWLAEPNKWVVALVDVTALAELNRVKRHMLLMVSHDLRNPLTSLLMYTYQLKRDDQDPDRTKIVGYIEKAAKTMQSILVDVIDLEQVRVLDFPRAPVALSSVLEAVAERYEPDCATKRLTMRLDIDTAVPAVLAHEAQITQVVANLVSNAVKYTPEGGAVTLRLRAHEPSAVRIEVQDNGVGIAKDAQAKLFTEFYRVKTRATGDITGTGLGLSLVKTIVEKHGGKVWVESEEDKGSTFYVELPALVAEKTG
jgi:signal transduction histidine kinase